MRSYYSPFRWVWVAIGLAILALLVAGFVALVYRGLILGQSIFPPMSFGTPFVFFPLFGIGWLILVVLVIGLALRLIFRPWRARWYGYYRRFDPAMQTLRERYARGEITKDQYEQMSRDLNNS